MYHLLSEAGCLDDYGKTELIDGEIVPMTQPAPRHFMVALIFAAYLKNNFGALGHVRREGPVAIDPFNETAPDVCLVQGRPTQYRDHHPGARDILLVVEVSNTSQQKDTGRKLASCARAGIPDYYVADLKAETITRYWQPMGETYGQSITWRVGDTIALAAGETAGASFPVAALLALTDELPYEDALA